MAPLVAQVAAPELTTFGVYLAGMVGIGVWVYNRTSTLGDFVLGGRGLSSPVAALSAQASDMSGWLLLGLPAPSTPPASARPGSRSASRSGPTSTGSSSRRGCAPTPRPPTTR